MSLRNEIELFLKSQSRRELALALGVKYKVLTYNLFVLKESKRYIEFEISKRNGGVRPICAPNTSMKFIQRKLADILINLHPQKSCVHSYALSKGILSNAKQHIGKKVIVNIDLLNFFPSINFGRVRGLFLSHPFNFNHEVATTLAQICTYKGTLPQGAPCSPIISNFICRRLDNQFIDLSRNNRLTYTRYADDITLSTNDKRAFPIIGTFSDNVFQLSTDIQNVIDVNGFKINDKKVRHAFKNNRQEVTGLIVNEKVNVNRKYIRHVRAMLNAAEKYGIQNAAIEHFSKYNHRFKSPTNLELSFLNELVGKIGFIGYIKGRGDKIYKRLHSRIKVLKPEVNLAIIQHASEVSEIHTIYCEGKTDGKHLKAALTYFQSKGDFANLEIAFFDYPNELDINNESLLHICEGLSKTKKISHKSIALFDRDTKRINSKVVTGDNDFKYWGNNVYSVLLPIPDNRRFEEICIEHYYSDNDLKIKDSNGRRLYLSTEFDKFSGKHNTDEVSFTNKNVLKSNYPRILDSNIVNSKNENVALSKNAFANYVVQRVDGFSEVSFENFKPVFLLLKQIIDHNP